jgi:hypothetical protein
MDTHHPTRGPCDCSAKLHKMRSSAFPVSPHLVLCFSC